MFCSKCGNNLPDGARFCGKCGAPQSAPEAPALRHLYMDAKGLTLMNYKFEIRDASGALCYKAATVTESLVSYNARVYNPDDTEAMIIHQQKKLTLAAMNFDLFAPDGSLVTEVLQKVHFTTSEFQLPQLGITVTGDFFSVNFAFQRAGQTICTVRKKVLSWGDCYELEYADPALERVLLATIMVIQMVIAAARRRRR